MGSKHVRRKLFFRPIIKSEWLFRSGVGRRRPCSKGESESGGIMFDIGWCSSSFLADSGSADFKPFPCVS
eukprot:scaffold41731_cov214-Amphora_coffeaeformis.AAC.1